MSNHPIADTNPTGPRGFMDLVAGSLRAPTTVLWDQATRTATFVFTPDLTAAEVTTFGDLLALVRTRDVELTPAEYAVLKPFLATGRAFTALSQAEFIALAQNARDRMLFDNVTALWRVIFRLLRDS